MENILTDIYFSIRAIPGWLNDCIQAGYEPDEIEFLEKLDNRFSSYQPREEANKWAKEINSQGGGELVSLENDDQKIKFVVGKISEFYLDLEKVLSGSWTYTDVLIRKKELAHWIKLRNSLRAREVHTTDRSLPESDLVKARQYPLERLLGLNEKTLYVLCPWHDDAKPSFLVKNGFGYCFSCGAWSDSIKWLMVVEKKSFKEAVEILCR